MLKDFWDKMKKRYRKWERESDLDDKAKRAATQVKKTTRKAAKSTKKAVDRTANKVEEKADDAKS